MRAVEKFIRLQIVIFTAVSFLTIDGLIPLMHNHDQHQGESANCPAYVLQLSLQGSADNFNADPVSSPEREIFITTVTSNHLHSKNNLHPLSNKAPPLI